LDGYKKAWEDLSAKLEAGKDEYIYSTDNKYLADEENVKDDVDLFSEGMELFKAGKIREAILAFEAEVKKDGSNSEAWRMLGTYSFNLSFCLSLYLIFRCNFLFYSGLKQKFTMICLIAVVGVICRNRNTDFKNMLSFN
jgi:hypothetical protein